MTLEIGLVFSILAMGLVMFITGWVRIDLAAMTVLSALALTGLVGPEEALAGFSSPAVVTVWAMFIMSEGLIRTGVARIFGRQVLKLAGGGERQVIMVIVLSSGALSAFMNNIAVVALMLPVVMDVSRVVSIAPSRLLMPLSAGTLLGGMTTLIGTPPNLLASQALGRAGFTEFGVFDYTHVGLPVLLVGSVFLALAGPALLPERDTGAETRHRRRGNLARQYKLHERSAILRIPDDSVLIGRTLGATRLSRALGLVVVGIFEHGRLIHLPAPDQVLRRGHRLLVQGRLDQLEELRRWKDFQIEREVSLLRKRLNEELVQLEVTVCDSSPLVSKVLDPAALRRRFDLNVVALRRDGHVVRQDLGTQLVEAGDTLLLEGVGERAEEARRSEHFTEGPPHESVESEELRQRYRQRDRMFSLLVPEGSSLVGASLESSRIGYAFDFRVLGLVREGKVQLMPSPDETLQAGDRILVQGRLRDLLVLRGLQELDLEQVAEPDLGVLESEAVGLMEVALSPRSRLANITLAELRFRQRFGVEVLAIWREGTAHRSALRAMDLRFGDAVLLIGPREKLRMLERSEEFLMLTQPADEEPVSARAPLAALILLAVLLPVLLGWQSIGVAAVIGATAMLLTGCLTMDQAYRAIEWRAIFLIACMLPLGTALQTTGGAEWVAQALVGSLGGLGGWWVVGGLYLLTALSTLVIPTAALIVLMAPIAIAVCAAAGVSPQTGMMAIALSSSACFSSPVSHPANLLVMGPGGYRFSDYLRLGVPLTLVVMLVVMTLLPFAWPLS
ncbi:MAG: SLC13 family permease [Pseudomonadota bacterium]